MFAHLRFWAGLFGAFAISFGLLGSTPIAQASDCLPRDASRISIDEQLADMAGPASGPRLRIKSPISFAFVSGYGYFVIDSALKRVERVDETGRMLPTTGFTGMSNPLFITYDPGVEQIFIYDYDTGQIKTFDPSGTAVANAYPAVFQASAIYVNPLNHLLYVASPGRIAAFSPVGVQVASSLDKLYPNSSINGIALDASGQHIITSVAITGFQNAVVSYAFDLSSKTASPLRPGIGAFGIALDPSLNVPLVSFANGSVDALENGSWTNIAAAAGSQIFASSLVASNGSTLESLLGMNAIVPISPSGMSGNPFTGPFSGIFQPEGVTIAPDGRLFVVNDDDDGISASDFVSVYTHDGTLITGFPTHEHSIGESLHIAYDNKRHRLFLVSGERLEGLNESGVRIQFRADCDDWELPNNPVLVDEASGQVIVYGPNLSYFRVYDPTSATVRQVSTVGLSENRRLDGLADATYDQTTRTIWVADQVQPFVLAVSVDGVVQPKRLIKLPADVRALTIDPSKRKLYLLLVDGRLLIADSQLALFDSQLTLAGASSIGLDLSDGSIVWVDKSRSLIGRVFPEAKVRIPATR